MNLEDIEAYDVSYAHGQTLEMSDGAKLYYEIRGPENAPTIVFVNNYFIIAPLWKNFTSRLAEKYRIVSYDLRNQGGSTRAKDDMSFDDHVRDLREIIERLDLGSVYVVGSSAATLIARDCALAIPDKTLGMVAVAPMFNAFGGRRRKYVVKSWIRAVETGGVRGLFDTMYPLIYSDRTVEAGGSATYLAIRERFLALNSPAQSIKNLKASLSSKDDWKKLAEIRCPTLLMAGDQDFYTCAGALDELASIIPDARSAIIPAVGHLPYFEATDEFERLIDDFVTEIEARNAGESGQQVA